MDNITAQGLTMGTMTPKDSKSMDQRLLWLKCRNAQCQFCYLGTKASSIAPTIPANTIHPNITNMYTHSTFLTAIHSQHSDQRTHLNLTATDKQTKLTLDPMFFLTTQGLSPCKGTCI
jgi:hypothetical protein